MKVSGLSIADAFEAIFEKYSWETTHSHAPEIGYEKITLYGLNGEPKHAARMLPNGLWTSKLGQNIDLAHQLSELCGPVYGTVMRVYRRKLGSRN